MESDVRDAGRLSKVLKKIGPDRIFHLAALTSVESSWKRPAETLDHNVTGTRSLLESVRKHCPRARVRVAGSAEVYGFCRRARRLDETAPIRPMNPYAVSKVAQEALAQMYFLSYGLSVLRTRAFNHIGPGQSERFVTSSFARQVARAEAQKQRPVIEVGNLSAVRDFTDVRDVVRAYWLCIERGAPGEVYNVCSGVGRPVAEILRYDLKHSAVRIKVRKNKRRFRAADAPVLVGDPRKLKARTGWKPAIGFERTLGDILEYWRRKAAAES